MRSHHALIVRPCYCPSEHRHSTDVPHYCLWRVDLERGERKSDIQAPTTNEANSAKRQLSDLRVVLCQLIRYMLRQYPDVQGRSHNMTIRDAMHVREALNARKDFRKAPPKRSPAAGTWSQVQGRRTPRRRMMTEGVTRFSSQD